MMKKITAICMSVIILLTGSVLFTACSSKNDVVEIDFFQHNQADEETFNKIIADFHSEYPNIRVKQICLPEKTADSVITMRFQNNDIPDIFNSWFAQNIIDAFDAGQIRDLTDTDFVQYIDAGILEELKYNGRIFMLPITKNFMGVFYNRDIFEQHNISVPLTLEEFWAVCETLPSKGVLPIIAADQDGWNLAHWAQSLMGMYLPNYSADFKAIFNGSLRGSKIQGISDFADIVIRRTQYVQDNPLGTVTDPAVSEFVLGRAAMFLNGSYMTASIETANPNLNYGIFPFPGSTESETRVMSNADYSFFLSAQSSPEKTEAAETFMMYMLTHGAAYYIEQTKAPSSIIGVTADSSRYELVKDVMDEGRVFRMPYMGRWNLATYLEYTVALQNLVASSNKDTFYKEFEESMTSVGMPKTYID